MYNLQCSPIKYIFLQGKRKAMCLSRFHQCTLPHTLTCNNVWRKLIWFSQSNLIIYSFSFSARRSANHISHMRCSSQFFVYFLVRLLENECVDGVVIVFIWHEEKKNTKICIILSWYFVLSKTNFSSTFYAVKNRFLENY